MRAIDRLLELPVVYRLWQAPFAARKFAPAAAALASSRPHRILDVGCGPGTNASFFSGCEYVGLDINEQYLAIARSRFAGVFIAADLATADLSALGRFDAVLVNSFLHHLPDDAVHRILSQVRALIAEGGEVHILELVRPSSFGIARAMAALDRGHYARPVPAWQEMFEEHFVRVACTPYMLGAVLWSMVYFRGRPR